MSSGECRLYNGRYGVVCLSLSLSHSLSPSLKMLIKAFRSLDYSLPVCARVLCMCSRGMDMGMCVHRFVRAHSDSVRTRA